MTECDLGTKGCAANHFEDVMKRGPLIVSNHHGGTTILREGCRNEEGYAVCICESRVQPHNECPLHP